MNIKKSIGRYLPSSLKDQYHQYKSNVISRRHKGNTVHCPICESNFDIFGTFGINSKRKNALCYKCGSKERHRLLFLYLNDLGVFNKDANLRLLHFAPEKMFYDIFSQNKSINYTPCDLEPERYRYSNGPAISQVNITDIPFEDNTFDLIICNHVLEHVPDDIAAISELYRVLNNGGHGYLQVPIDYNRDTTYEDPSITSPEDRLRIFGQSDHVRIYGKDYKDRLASVGFKVNEDDYVKQYSDEDAFKFGIRKSELIYYCKK